MKAVVLVGAVLGLVAVWGWKTFGWLRLDEPLVEQKRRAFDGLTPRYRRTQEPNLTRLQIGWWKRRKRA